MNYRYEDEIRAEQEQCEAIDSQIDALADVGTQLVTAFGHVKTPDDLLNLSEDLSSYSLEVRRLARHWRRSLDFDMKARRAEALIDQMRDERL